MKTLQCITANETGFSQGYPLCVPQEHLSHKDSVIECYRRELMEAPYEMRTSLLDTLVMWLESIHEHDVYAPPYVIGEQNVSQ